MNVILNHTSLSREPDLLRRWLPKLFADAAFLRASYPGFDRWLASKVVPGLQSGERTLVIEIRQSDVVGILILKHSPDEMKLCTLRVRPTFESRGLGVRLFERAFEVLGTEQPLLSVSEDTQPRFARLFQYFGFAKRGTYNGLYLPRKQEFSYNGELGPVAPVTVPSILLPTCDAGPWVNEGGGCTARLLVAENR